MRDTSRRRETHHRDGTLPHQHPSYHCRVRSTMFAVDSTRMALTLDHATRGGPARAAAPRPLRRVAASVTVDDRRSERQLALEFFWKEKEDPFCLHSWFGKSTSITKKPKSSRPSRSQWTRVLIRKRRLVAPRLLGSADVVCLQYTELRKVLHLGRHLEE